MNVRPSHAHFCACRSRLRPSRGRRAATLADDVPRRHAGRDQPRQLSARPSPCKTALAAGYAPARQLVAESIDRYLSVTTGTQRYGTNRFINQKGEQEELAPIDRSTTDAERATYGVPPLAELLKKFPEAAELAGAANPSPVRRCA
jgi:hypothetical protein